MLSRIFSSLLLLCISISSNAASTLVAVAANFTKPMNEIAAEFEKATGHSAKLSFGSSGRFVNQIENGAPFEVFLSAGISDSQKLIQDGLAIQDSQFIYALGKLVLWSSKPGYVDDQGTILSKGGYTHLAIADPKLAPYGLAATETLKALGLTEKTQALLVQGENIAQTQQFVQSGNAELGFVALSQVYEDGKITSGSAWIIPSHYYSPIQQNAVLLTLGKDNPAAHALLAFLKTPPAISIIKKYGYELAN